MIYKDNLRKRRLAALGIMEEEDGSSGNKGANANTVKNVAHVNKLKGSLC